AFPARRIDVPARLANGVLVSMTGNAGVAGRPRTRATILGDGGAVVGDGPLELEELWIEAEGRDRERLGAEGPVTSLAGAFVAAVLDGAENPTPPEEAARVVAFAEAVYRSAADGRV